MSLSDLDYETMNKEAVKLLQELIRNKCVNDGTPDSGNEIRNVNTLVKYFEFHGIKDYEIFEPHKTRGNILIRIVGKDSKKPSLMYQSHLDVVPAGDDWSVPPFDGVIEDNWLYGRGAIDMLIYTATHAVAFAHLHKAGWKPQGDLVFLAVANEESLGDFGAKWLVENVPDKIKTTYMLSEFGGAVLTTPKGPLTLLMIGEKGIGWCKVSIEGQSGHGSTPYMKDNALSKLADIINKIDKAPPPAQLTATWKEFIKSINLGKFSEFLLTHKKTINFAIRQTAKRDSGLARSLHALTRMTITPTQAEASQKLNVIPDHASVYFDIRLLPGQTWDDVINYFKNTFKKAIFDQLLIEPINVAAGTSDPWQSDLLPYLKKTYKNIVSSGEIAPFFLPGATDARLFRQLGIKCYGFSILTEEIDLKTMTSMIHGKDEKVSLEAIHKSTRFFAELAQNFLG
jgi:acetylornithine deacetylase/succinyl-diaminopimelate desuccinylase-like protein